MYIKNAERRRGMQSIPLVKQMKKENLKTLSRKNGHYETFRKPNILAIRNGKNGRPVFGMRDTGKRIILYYDAEELTRIVRKI